MTSEIAVMNRQAVALAADSAVTFAGGAEKKIFPSANKIFALSEYQPIGVMVDGNASFMDNPWETVIKIYRNRLGSDSFKTVSGYAENFLDFLRQKDLLFSDSNIEQRAYVDGSIRWRFGRMRECHSKRIVMALVKEERIEPEFSQGLIAEIVQLESNKWSKAEAATTAPANFESEFFESFGGILREAIDKIFEGLPIPDESVEQLWEIAANLFLKFPTHVHIPVSSGVVFAGFGTDDVFPVLESYTIEGRKGDYLKHRRDEQDCARIGGSMGAIVLPFAHREMVDIFMAGVDPDYRRLTKDLFQDLGDFHKQISLDDVANEFFDPDEEEYEPHFSEDLRESVEPFWDDIMDELDSRLDRRFAEFQASLLKFSQERHKSPILSVVEGLPKDELATMAETLINLTSFKQRVSMQAETVGGPIDVAVISKGDGFIWIKRKHYFDVNLNPQFLANKTRE